MRNYFWAIPAIFVVPGILLYLRAIKITEKIQWNEILASTAKLMLLFTIVFLVLAYLIDKNTAHTSFALLPILQ